MHEAVPAEMHREHGAFRFADAPDRYMQPAFDLELAARHCIEHEWAEQLEDIALRRLMLHFRPGLSRQSFADLAALLVEKGKLQSAEVAAAIDRCAARLKNHFGLNLRHQRFVV